MKNFTKGFLAGIFNITPGLSGSILLIMLNLYDKCIYEINNFFKTPKRSIMFLFPIGLGIILGIFSFSNIIYLLINSHKKETFIVFSGFIFGTIPHLINKSAKNKFKKSYLITFSIALLLGLIMLILKNNILYETSSTSILKYIIIGILLSISTIIPGISSTILLSIFNLYSIYIISISKLNIFALLFILISFTITTFILSKIINYFLNNYHSHTYFAILGFTISTIPVLFSFNIKIKNLIISLPLAFISFVFTYTIFKVKNE